MGGSAVQRQKEVRTEINILGQTVDEATVSVGRFIDQALLGGVNQVRIIRWIRVQVHYVKAFTNIYVPCLM